MHRDKKPFSRYPVVSPSARPRAEDCLTAPMSWHDARHGAIGQRGGVVPFTIRLFLLQGAPSDDARRIFWYRLSPQQQSFVEPKF